MYKVAALLLLASSGYGLNDVSDKIMTKLHHFNLCSACWGEEYADQYIMSVYEASAKCYQSPSAMPLADSVLGFPANLISGYEDVDANDITEFGNSQLTMVNNFTCVMKHLGFLTEAGEINSDLFAHTETIELIDLDPENRFASGSRAGADPVFVKKLYKEIAECADLSKNYPTKSFEKSPFLKKFGKMAIYFNCIKKVERQTCAKYLIHNDLLRHGVKIDATGLNDKYDAAALAVRVMERVGSEEEKHIDEYFWGDLEA